MSASLPRNSYEHQTRRPATLTGLHPKQLETVKLNQKKSVRIIWELTSGLPRLSKGSAPTTHRIATSLREFISGLQSFRHVQAPRFAHHPGRSYRSLDIKTGQPRFLHPSTSRLVTLPCPGYASRQNRAIDDRGLSPHKTRGLIGRSRKVNSDSASRNVHISSDLSRSMDSGRHKMW
jgi:hypothetical protein